MGGGHFTNRPELVAALTHDAPVVIAWLEELGMMFDKHPDGRMLVRHGGGTCRKRMHSAGDMTGAEIMRVLRDEARSRTEPIDIMEFTAAVEILKDDKGRACGALMYNLETEEYFVVRSKAVVIATGGNGRLHIQGFACTNHYGATADGLVMGYRAGVLVRFPPLHPVPPHGRGLPGAERRPAHHGEGARPGRQSPEHQRRAVRLRARAPRRGERGHHPRVHGTGQRHHARPSAAWACGSIRP